MRAAEAPPAGVEPASRA